MSTNQPSRAEARRTTNVLRKALMAQINTSALRLLPRWHRNILVDRAMLQPPIVKYDDPIDIPKFPPDGYYACFSSEY